MEHFVMEKTGRVLVIKMDQGDYVLETIKEVIAKENLKNGVVVSGIGTLDQAHLHMITTTGYPIGEYHDLRDDEPLELLSIQGFIADGVPHLHTVISNKLETYAGHLEEGCRSLYLGEVVIMEVFGPDLYRVKNEHGAPQLTLK